MQSLSDMLSLAVRCCLDHTDQYDDHRHKSEHIGRRSCELPSLTPV